MQLALHRSLIWVLAWCAVMALGSVVLARLELARLQDAFETDARIVHRLLSQRAVQHDAVLATLALLQPQANATRPEQLLPSVYPQILSVQRCDALGAWPDARWTQAQEQSRTLRRPVLASADLANSRYTLLLAAQPTSYAMEMDLRAVVPWNEWPMAPDTSPVRVTLTHEDQTFVLQPGRVAPGGWRFEFHKHLAAQSQPFDVVAVRQVRWVELPWGSMLGWAVLVSAALALWRAVLHQRTERRRAEELLRLGQVSRLNTLGELAAGMAHELNQPLTAVLANAQAASRLLQDDPPDLVTARTAMTQTAVQARRAADVVGRLRRVVEQPNRSAPLQPIGLEDAVRNALHLLEPEFTRREVTLQLDAPTTPLQVLAEPVALEQIIHNLLMNALQALEKVPPPQRTLAIRLETQRSMGVVTLTDTGVGIPADVLPRIFDPFFTTRASGLGLGLSLCETLANGMGGTLVGAHHAPRGAVFTLALPLAVSA
jgi:C4-dicarboxylate-specific signal transduction histidine kinase